jgi:hypothetical protein
MNGVPHQIFATIRDNSPANPWGGGSRHVCLSSFPLPFVIYHLPLNGLKPAGFNDKWLMSNEK